MFKNHELFWLRKLPKDFQSYIGAYILTKGGAVLPALATLFLGGVLSTVLWQAQHEINILVWFSTLLLTVSLRLILTAPKMQMFIILTESLIGILWVIVVLMCFPVSPRGLQIFFALVILGAGLSSALFQHRILPAALCAVGFAMPILAVRFFLDQGNEQIFLAFMVISGWACSLGLVLYLHKSFLSRMALQFEKTSLLESVENHVVELDRLRKMEKTSRQVAEDANAAKSRFLAHASHDLRQPLHAIGLLLATIPNKGQSKQTSHVLGRIKQSLDVLSDLFDSLLDVALLDTGQVDVNISSFPINDVIEQVVQDFSGLAKQKNIHLQTVHTSVSLHSDPLILRRMVQNLVSNAIAHSHDCRVLVGVRRRRNKLCIEVHDMGSGIALADQTRIFEEFTKVATHKPKNDLPGLGLGLAIVQRLAKIIGAEITLKSSLGLGSVFRIGNLSRAKRLDIESPDEQIQHHKSRAQSAHIAIFDDDVEILKATENLVSKWGFKVHSYEKYDENTLRKPDIILCDYELMQPLNGIEVIAAIRATYSENIPAVLITGNNSKVLIQQAKAAQLSVLFKPVKPAQLRSILLTTLSGEI